jgi:hypothetical protein
MGSMRWDEERREKSAGIGGILFAALLMASLFTGAEEPRSDASGVEWLDYFQTDTDLQVLASMMIAAAAAMLLWFAASLRSFLWRIEGGPGRLATLGFGAAVVASVSLCTVIVIGSSVGAASELFSAYEIDLQAGLLVTAVANGFFAPTAIASAVIMGIPSVIALRTGFLARPVAIASLVAAALVALSPLVFFTYLLFPIWTLIAGIYLWQWSPEGAEDVTLDLTDAPQRREPVPHG